MSADRPRRSRGLVVGLVAAVVLVLPLGSVASQASVAPGGSTLSRVAAPPTQHRASPDRAREAVIRTISAVKNKHPERARYYATPAAIARVQAYYRNGFDLLAPGSCSGSSVVRCVSPKVNMRTRARVGSVTFQVRGSGTSAVVQSVS